MGNQSKNMKLRNSLKSKIIRLKSIKHNGTPYAILVLPFQEQSGSQMVWR